MIPKTIHYCWFGNNPKPEIIEKCIESWKTCCPDYDIKEWNESNYDLNRFEYVKEAYSKHYWAFVSDVVRLDVVCNYGGIYLDTDVELKTGLNELLDNEAFFFFETDRRVNTGMGFGACKQNSVVQAMLKKYEQRHFICSGGVDKTPCPALNTEALRECIDVEMNGKDQIIDGIAVLSGGVYTKIGRHWGTGYWNDSANPVENIQNASKRVYKDTILKRWLRQPEKYRFIERRFGKKALWIYEFLSYDVMENGILYFAKRWIPRLWRKE